MHNISEFTQPEGIYSKCCCTNLIPASDETNRAADEARATGDDKCNDTPET